MITGLGRYFRIRVPTETILAPAMLIDTVQVEIDDAEAGGAKEVERMLGPAWNGWNLPAFRLSRVIAGVPHAMYQGPLRLLLAPTPVSVLRLVTDDRLKLEALTLGVCPPGVYLTLIENPGRK